MPLMIICRLKHRPSWYEYSFLNFLDHFNNKYNNVYIVIIRIRLVIHITYQHGKPFKKKNAKKQNQSEEGEGGKQRCDDVGPIGPHAQTSNQ